jgi:monoamine oxidase
MTRDKIAIIGGGIAGLYMMKLLLAKGYEVTLFEAQHRLGGRIKGGEFKGQHIDLGAQWLHHVNGEENALTKVLKAAEEPFVSDEDEGEYPDFVSTFLEELKTTSFTRDQPLSNIINDPALKKYMDALLVDMAASSEHFSTIEFVKQIDAITTDDYLLKNRSMYEFISSWITDLPEDRIRLATPITSIHYSPDHVILNATHQFNKVIISVPVSQLQQHKISFSPALPKAKQAAIQQIGMGKGLKVFLFFKEAVLPEGTYNNESAPYYFPVQTGPYHVVVTLLMGHYADTWYKDPAKHRQDILQELSNITGQDIPSLLEGTLFHDWTHEPYIEGTYSFPRPGEGNARAIAAEPIEDTVFFIGEAMNTHLAYGFIHGAMDTAFHLSQRF